jgi:BMFP domain-containing protein YqiC
VVLQSFAACASPGEAGTIPGNCHSTKHDPCQSCETAWRKALALFQHEVVASCWCSWLLLLALFGALFSISGGPGVRLMDAKFIEDLARKLAANVPGSVRVIQADLERNFQALLASTFDKLNLVTREEFDVQRKVLERTRDKLTALEAELAALESRQGGSDS